jgi:hypothetical protein
MFDDGVTSLFGVLRICVGVLRDVTVLIRVSGDPLGGDQLIFRLSGGAVAYPNVFQLVSAD